MKASSFDLEQAMQGSGGVIARRDHPGLSSAIDWQVRQRRLRPVLPGVYARPDGIDQPDLRIAAAMAWRPDAVLVGQAAGRVSFWPTIPVPVIDVAAGVGRFDRAGFRITERQIPPELIRVRGRLRYTDPALTALDLCDTVNGDGIDTALRTRAATLDGIRSALALTGGRAGNRRRHELLIDSRNEPWSAAERVGHQLLREAGISGWCTNYPVRIAEQSYFLDIAFRDRLLAIEIDGRLHDGPGLFESDRWRQNHLILAGWRVLRFTWAMLTRYPQMVVRAVRDALRR